MDIAASYRTSVRMTADLALGLSIPILCLKLYRTGHIGVSLSSQLLLLLAFTTRYADLLFLSMHVSAYSDSFKYYYTFGTLACSLAIIDAHIRTRCAEIACSPARALRAVLWLSVPCLALGYAINYTSPLLNGGWQWYIPRQPLEVAWAFSCYLAVPAAIPQLRVLRRAEVKDPWIFAYLGLLFVSRALYLPYHYLRYHEEHVFDFIGFCAGVAQTAVFLAYVPVFVLDRGRRRKGGAIQLPAYQPLAASEAPSPGK